MSLFLSVRNNGNTPFAAKYDGREYVFAPDQLTIIDADAARHIFGVGMANKTEVLTRHGWLSHSSGLANAMAKLDAFSFSIPNENPDDEPVVELASLLTPAPVVEDDNEQGSAPLLLGGGEEAGQLNGEPDELLPPISTGGGILSSLKNFLK